MIAIPQTARTRISAGTIAKATSLRAVKQGGRKNRQEPREGLRVKIATDWRERIAAFHLVYDRYRSSGLIEGNHCRLRVTKYHLQDTTDVYIALRGQEVVATVTLIRDKNLGLPLEVIFANEVDKRREQGLCLSEVSCLAVKSQNGSTLPIIIELTRLMAQHARLNGIDQLLVAVHPRHARFYERYMGFETIGPVKSYPMVRNRPAVVSCLDFAHVDRYRPSCWGKYFGVPLPKHELRSQPMSARQRAFLQTLMPDVSTHEPLLIAV